MNKFKAGDRVRYVGKGEYAVKRYFDEVGTVTDNTGAHGTHVDFDNGEHAFLSTNNFELESGNEPTQKIVDIAKGLVYGDRGEAYGHPAEDYARVALIWSGILGVDITPVQAIQCMVGIKLSRLSNTPDHRDSWVDIAGYAECGDRINRYQAGDKDS